MADCPECGDKKVVTRYVGGSYDHPPNVKETVPCPKCVKISPTYKRDLNKPQPAFPMEPAKGKN